jgi:putative endonuclease
MRKKQLTNPKIARGGKSHAEGRQAEHLAALLLMAKGYHILARRWRAAPCEIDILARQNDTLVVVEVKKRGQEMAAGEALAPELQRRLIEAGNAALAWHGGWAKNLRFDVILLSPRRFPRHIKNAFF